MGLSPLPPAVMTQKTRRDKSSSQGVGQVYPDFLTEDTRGGGHTHPLYRVTAPLSHAPQTGWACIQQPGGGTPKPTSRRRPPRRGAQGPVRVAQGTAWTQMCGRQRCSLPFSTCLQAGLSVPSPTPGCRGQPRGQPALGVVPRCPLRGHPGFLCQSLQWLPEELPAAPRGLLAQSDTPSPGPSAPSWLPSQPRQQG